MTKDRVVMYEYDIADTWHYDSSINAVVFRVNVHGLSIKCIVSRDLIETRFGQCNSDEECMEKAIQHVDVITAIIDQKIINKEFKDGTISL